MRLGDDPGLDQAQELAKSSTRGVLSSLARVRLPAGFAAIRRLAPFAGVPDSSAGIGPWHAEGGLDHAHAQVSRVAPADIAAPCLIGSPLQDVNGFLSMGIGRVWTGGAVAFD